LSARQRPSAAQPEETARRGIERLSADGIEIVVASGDGAAKVEGRHDAGLEIILAGINARPRGLPKGTPKSNERLSTDEMRSALAEANAGHDAVIKWLDELFMDVLHKAGGNVEALNLLDESESNKSAPDSKVQ